MKYAFLCLAITSQVLATDVALVRRSVVKIVSKIQGASAELRGSGLLFSRDGKRYVLTSDHVVAHSNGIFGSHTAASSVTGEQLRLKFLASEWGNGLALMLVENDSAAKDAVPYTDLFQDSTPQVGERASFYGYPFESDDLTEETFGKVLSLSMKMPYYVFSKDLVELEAAVGEFGMSGGAAFTQKDQFLGVVAYQRILQENANRVYLVPRSIVLPWLEHYFKVTDKYIPYFSEPWFVQGDPRQCLLTNDKLLIMFRLWEGKFRLGIGNISQLLILQDGPSIPWDDSKGFTKFFRKFVTDEPNRPSEYAIVDRSSGKPFMKQIRFPAEVFASFEQPNISLLLVIGERHEERYERVKKVADQLARVVSDLEAKMKPSPTAEWLTLSKDLSALLDKLKAMPPKPQDPGAAGANEFFSAYWVGGIVYQVELNFTLAGWKDAEAKALESAKATRASLKNLVDSMKVTEFKP